MKLLNASRARLRIGLPRSTHPSTKIHPARFRPLSTSPQHQRPPPKSGTSPDTRPRTAIVTGAATGIGKAIALRLARDGYDLTLNDLPSAQASLDAVAATIASLGTGRRAHTHAADVSSLTAVSELVEASVAALGPLDTMVANAGVAQVKPLLELTEDDFARTMAVNVAGVQNCYQAAAKQMVAQGAGGGKLLGAASIAAFKPFALLGHYSASKWAVRGLTQAWAMEVAGEGITVNAYAPGIVGTSMWDGIDEGLALLKGARKGDMIKKYSEDIALGRTSVPEDVSNLVSFLASDGADYITGQTYIVDGGIVYT